MKLENKVAIVTGSANGMGAAMAMRFSDEGATSVIVSDIDLAGAEEVAHQICCRGGSAIALRADVSVEADVQNLVRRALADHGRVDLFCSNAGLLGQGGAEAPDALWQATWAVNVMAHVYAARAALPSMLENKSGYFLNNCSAAGLLTNLGAAPYAATKHAAVAFAEWLSITYGNAGIRVSALCPSAVRTNMLADSLRGEAAASAQTAGSTIEPEELAQIVIDGLDAERFLILTQSEVAEYVRRRATDIDRWLGGMRRIWASSGATL
jgi:NAD(P)-dependent dehydrogenase (short-subunit alcohol dehydrogenase family)